MPQLHWMAAPKETSQRQQLPRSDKLGARIPPIRDSPPNVDFFAKTALPRNKQQTFQRRNVNFPEMESKLSKGGTRVGQTTTIAPPWESP